MPQYALRGLGFSPSKEDVSQLLAKYARATEGALTQQEFRVVTQRLREAEDPQKNIKQMFQLLDTEGVGYITATDLQQAWPPLIRSISKVPAVTLAASLTIMCAGCRRARHQCHLQGDGRHDTGVRQQR